MDLFYFNMDADRSVSFLAAVTAKLKHHLSCGVSRCGSSSLWEGGSYSILPPASLLMAPVPLTSIPASHTPTKVSTQRIPECLSIDIQAKLRITAVVPQALRRLPPPYSLR